jgi:3-dehydroquinate synthase
MSIETLTVELGARSYPIVIGGGLLDGEFDFSPYLAGPDCLVVTNETVGPLYLDRLLACLPDANVQSISLPDGEQYKTMATVEAVLDSLVAMRAGRDATVIALGGGVVGDIAGFAAACYMRGVAFIQVPTSLLAQVDSSVGGKTGVNHAEGKNLVGAFHQPRVVLIDTDTLSTLPDRELRAGIAEVIKYGAIVDRDFFEWLERSMDGLLARDPEALATAIKVSCATKASVVAEDEREAGKRALLNFGHTFGHAIESTAGYGEWLHGEAVATGMLMASQLSGLDADQHTRLRKLIDAAGLPTAPPKVGAVAMRNAMQGDKKVLAGKVRFILLRQIGEAFVSADVSDDALGDVLAAAEA